MPIYEFRCESCKHEFEALCRIGSNGRGQSCPRCSKKRLRRLMSTFSARSGGSTGAGASRNPSSCAGCSSHNCATCH